MSYRIAITPGEPSGIGPDIVLQAAQRDRDCEWVVVADPQLLRERAAILRLPINIREVDWNVAPSSAAAGELIVVPITLLQPVIAGKLNFANAGYVLASLDAAIELCVNGRCQALVTGPIQKSIINDAGVAFTGHTEYLAEKAGCDVVMMLATEGLRVALATTHLPLAQVPAAITTQGLRQVIKILQRDLVEKFGLASPRILVCGLNPHAGEGGHLGREEIEIIEPLLNDLRAQGLNLVGPLPADTLFQPKYLDGADAVLAMYHDQGLPVLKYKGFGKAVNITLGLPYIRTSVDHGTALDLAGTGEADCGSLDTALKYASNLIGKSYAAVSGRS